MTRQAFINPQATAAQGGRPLSRELFQWLRELWQKNGSDAFSPRYAEISLSLVSLDGLAGVSVVNPYTDFYSLYWDFVSDSDAPFAFKLPQNYVAGTALRPALDWHSGPNGDEGFTVVFTLKAWVFNSGDTLSATPDVDEEIQADSLADDTSTRTMFSTISGTELRPGAIVAGTIGRPAVSNSADDWNRNVFADFFNLIYEAEGAGALNAQTGV